MKNTMAKKSRRATRYGKLVRGWDWRTAKNRLTVAAQLASDLEVSKTQLLEMAVDELLKKHNLEIPIDWYEAVDELG